MRRLATLLSFFLGPLVFATLCPEPVLTPVAPLHVEAQCSYSNAAIAAEGDAVFAVWMTSRTGGFGFPITTGTMSGGHLNASGHLVEASQQPLNQVPAHPSVATNGTTWMLAWTRDGRTGVQHEQWGSRIVADANAVGDPRAVWDGHDFIVLTTEGPALFALRLDGYGGVAERNEIARNTILGDAVRAGDGRTLVVTPAETVMLSGISVVSRNPLLDVPADASMAVARNGDSFLVAWESERVAVAQLDAHGDPTGRLTLQKTTGTAARRVAVAVSGSDYVVLWNDYPLVRGMRVRDLAVRGTIEPTQAFVLDAATTSAGAVVLLSRGCGFVESATIERDALVRSDTISREASEQVPLAFVTTPGGSAVFWSEAVPTERASRLYASHVTSDSVSAPALLNTPGTLLFDAQADWPIVLWAEYPHDSIPGSVRAARIGSNGEVLWNSEISTGGYFPGFAVSGNDIYTAERAAGEYYSDVYRTRVSDGGAILSRTLLMAHFDPLVLQAAPGIWTWLEASPGSVRLVAREEDDTHMLPVPLSFALQDTVTSDVPMVLWSERETASRVHAWFPQTGSDVVIAPSAAGLGFATAERAANGGFDVAIARWPLLTDTTIDVVNVSPTGAVTPREQVCFPWFHPSQIALRNGRVDAVTTTERHQVVIVRQRSPRRRALH